MISHLELSNEALMKKILRKEIQLAGNARLKIYGMLSCRSGKRMKRENRVFFKTEEDAILSGFRPCGHCMLRLYHQWKMNK